jgi:hypothetical protein
MQQKISLFEETSRPVKNPSSLRERNVIYAKKSKNLKQKLFLT